MAFVIKLRVEKDLLEEEKLNRKIKFLGFFIKNTKNYFKPEKTIIMADAPLLEIGGTKKSEFNGFSEKKLISNISQPERTIVKIEGSFSFKIKDKPVSIPAYIYLYNKEDFKKFYDIEFDLYSYKDIDSISDVVLLSDNFRNELLNLVKELTVFDIVEMEKCFVGSLESTEDVRQRTFSYYRYPFHMILDMVKTLKSEGEENTKSEIPLIIAKHLLPYKKEFLARRLWALKEFKITFDNYAKDFNINLKDGSLSAIALEKDSFEKLYSTIRNKILMPGLKELQSDDDIMNKFKRTITGEKQISDYK